MTVHVVADKQVKESVAIVVGKRRSCGPSAIAYAGLFGNVGEGAVSVVAIQHVASQASEIDVSPAIVALIAHRPSPHPPGLTHAGSLRPAGAIATLLVRISCACRS